MQIGDVFPFGKLLGKKGPLVLDSSAYTVVYFYPKDQTHGCTIQAHEFQVAKPQYDAAKIRIVGVSRDDAASHEAFCSKDSLTFELATDPNGTVGKELDIISLIGLHKRTTYVLDRDANVVLIYPSVSPAGHAKAVLADIKALGP